MVKLSIERPWHKHALTMRELSENCCVDCGLCGQGFHGRTYCCEDCDLFVHELCGLIEFPPQMQHPSHPQHPLAFDACAYQCSFGDCHFSLDAMVAVATLPPLPRDKSKEEEEEEMVLWHKAHTEHPLTSFHVDTMLPIECSRCGECISGHVYGCRACIFLLHEPCAQSPTEMQNPAVHQHPLTLVNVDSDWTLDAPPCSACHSPIYGNAAYGCAKCMFILDLRCATRILLPRDEERDGIVMIKQLSHDHALAHFHVKEANHLPISCEVCEENISGEVYGCFLCSFFLHRSCADQLPGQEIQHHLHPEHPLLLQERRKSTCDSCLENLSGLAFCCRSKACDFEMHPKCALQTHAAVEAGVPEWISDPSGSGLVLQFFREGDADPCSYCKQPVLGLGYHDPDVEEPSESETYLCLHMSCSGLSLTLVHDFHPLHPLKMSFLESADYFYCGACCERHTGPTYYYCCAECGFHLDMLCAVLNRTLQDPRHEHRLAYFEKSASEDAWLKCKSCGKRCKRDFYCCVPCNFCLHNDCLPLPPIVEHTAHFHPIALCDKFVDGDPRYQYCDHCETIRNPDKGVYRCEECSFSAHIDCIIPNPEVESSGVEISGTDRLNQLNIEIASLKEKIELMRRNLSVAKANLVPYLAKVEGLEIIKGI